MSTEQLLLFHQHCSKFQEFQKLNLTASENAANSESSKLEHEELIAKSFDELDITHVKEISYYWQDDILGTVAKYGENNDMNVLLLTGDRDALQLSSDKVTIRIPTTRMGKTESTDYTPEVIKEKFGIEPLEFIQIKGLMGDTSDNIPGVPGVGEKTAFSLITKYHDIDVIYNELDAGNEVEGVKGKLKEKLVANKDLAYLSRDLGTIFREVPLDFENLDIERKELIMMNCMICLLNYN